mmetsp:Transcript_29361/g.83545  ORF Transcript_29361/g.83545 Transcript_29361/m.83545 type:complete len:239 (-) Transcript_29361:528-1244(-)
MRRAIRLACAAWQRTCAVERGLQRGIRRGIGVGVRGLGGLAELGLQHPDPLDDRRGVLNSGGIRGQLDRGYRQHGGHGDVGAPLPRRRRGRLAIDGTHGVGQRAGAQLLLRRRVGPKPISQARHRCAHAHVDILLGGQCRQLVRPIGGVGPPGHAGEQGPQLPINVVLGCPGEHAVVEAQLVERLPEMLLLGAHAAAAGQANSQVLVAALLGEVGDARADRGDLAAQQVPCGGVVVLL